MAQKEKYTKAIDGLLEVYQTNWKLLNKTYEVISKLDAQCKLSHRSIQRWQNLYKATSDYSDEKKKLIIGRTLKDLTKWLDNDKGLTALQQDWEKFREDVENFDREWQKIAGSLAEELKSNEV